MVVGTQRFSDPDQVANLHAAIFMACNAVGLFTGWTFGWLIGGRLVSNETPPT
jgi:hypothetical protein